MRTSNPESQIALLEHKVNALTQLTDLSTFLTSQMELRAILISIMETTAEITNSETASVLLWNNKTNELYFVASTQQKEAELFEKPVPLDSIAGTALVQNCVIQVDDAKSDPRHYDQIDEDIQFETKSLLTVPMIYKDRKIGVLQAVNKRTLPWLEDDIHYLEIIAAQAAVAIEDAQLLRNLKQANEELNELDKLKNDFIAIASHELRTPLGVIMGYASFLEEETDEETRAHAQKVMESALQLRQIIEDMINLRYLKQHQSDLNLELVPVTTLIDDIQDEFYTLAEASEHRFNTIAPEQQVMIQLDRGRMSLALNNLLNNAVRFTPRGGEITLKIDDIRSDEVWILIQDTGIGLEADQVDKVFKEFYQAEDHSIRHHGGLGIGLSITKAVIEAHNGRIWASSEGSNLGTTFTIALPKL